MNLNASEHQEQAAFVDWLKLKGIRHYATPNGAYLGRDPVGRAIQMKKLKAEGFSPGVPDLVIPYRTKDYGGFYCEMKRKGGRVDEAQTDWHEFLRGQGYRVTVCYSSDEAIKETMQYFNGVPNA